MLSTKLASPAIHLLLCSLYIQHLTCGNTDHILYKILKDNASYANSIYSYEHRQFWHSLH